MATFFFGFIFGFMTCGLVWMVKYVITTENKLRKENPNYFKHYKD